MIFVIAAGLLLLPGIRQEPFPNVAFDLISITVVYPGAAPDEVEEAICIRIEESIQDLEGIKRIRSTATEGFGNVTAELESRSDRRRLLDEIRTRVDGLDTLPVEARRPVVQDLVDDHVWLTLAIYGDVDELTLRLLAEQLRDEVSGLPNVGIAELAGVRPYELSIEVSDLQLRQHGLTFDGVVGAVQASSLDLSGGSLKTRGGEILLRTEAQAYRGLDFERLLLLTREDGTRLPLGEVARVVDGFAETGSIVRFDGKPAAMVRFLSGEGRQVARASDAVHAHVEAARERMPDGVELATWSDDSRQLKSRRELLVRNAQQGLVLVVLVLILFLPLRLAFWVCVGLPVSFFGALIVMAALDVSINMLSLFAFIVALGLVVDDAIIVAESIERSQLGGGNPVRAAIAGAREISVPVVLAVLTTVLFLLPILVAPGFTAKIARSVPIVVSACLLFSLVESLLVLPAHLSHAGGQPRRGPATLLGVSFSGVQPPLGAALERFIDRVYRPALVWVLRWPGLTVSLSVSVMMLAFATVLGGWIGFDLLAAIEGDVVSARIEMP
jgi:multidrug efflux pump subunit AcrB